MGMYDGLEGMEDILDDFVVETGELIDQLDEDLLLLESGEYDDELINRVFRAYHTIKGTSGFLNFEQCTNLAHAAEDVLNTIRSGKLESSPQVVDVLLETVDWFKEFVGDVQNREENDRDIRELLDIIDEILGRNGHSRDEQTTDTEAVQAEPEKDSENGDGFVLNLSDFPEELVKEFVTESLELIEALNVDVLQLEESYKAGENGNYEDLVNNIFRAFHTLKGNSGILGLDTMSQVAHKSEDVLNLIRDQKLSPKAEVIDAILESVDWIKNFVEGIRDQGKETGETGAIISRLKAITDGVGENRGEAQEQKPKAAKTQRGERKPRKKIDQTIRVDVERLDILMNLAGELVLGKNRLLQVSHQLNQLMVGNKLIDDLNSVNNDLGFVTTEIQESIMQMRMLPISNVFRKFPRVVRDLAREKQKEVELVVSGEDTELDRSVIELIGDPLVHLLRNAIDHGIEPPEIRVERGKPAKGTVALSAYQEGNHIVIEIQDDGAGIDPDKVLKKAIEKGLVTAEEGEKLSRRDIINLIFKPGFSTAEVITDVSGRGVGMDVVHSNISKLNGTIEIKTEVGVGSTFIIKLPLTLTILTGMVVRVWRELYIIPLISIIETLKLEKEMISSIQGQEVIQLREMVLPLVRLDELLQVERNDDGDYEANVVVVSVADKQLGLVVSELLGQEETVVKSFGQAIGKVPYVGGATIRGDGRVCLILDVPEMMKHLIQKQ
jgi:two-component system chemotaxis sensor kinase CheA